MKVYLLDGTTFETIGLLDNSYEQLQIVRRYWGLDNFIMRVHRRRLYADQIVSGNIIWLPDEENMAFLIEQIAGDQTGSVVNDWMTVYGRSLDSFASEERRIIPPPGEDYDEQHGVPGETAMKHYMDDHAGPSADAERQIPGLVIETDAARGDDVTTDQRYTTITQALKEIGMLTGLGWQGQFSYNTATPSSSTLEFQVIDGMDHSTDVFFDFEYETLEEWHELERILDSKTFAIVAGQGEGADREVVERYQGVSEPEGYARREAFIDARDVALGNLTLLAARGDAFLVGAAPERSVEAKEHQFGSFQYRRDWDLGDIVLIRNRTRGLQYASRVVEIYKTETREDSIKITAVMDRPFPTLKEKMSAGSSSGTGSIIVDQPVGGTGGGGGSPFLDGGTPSSAYDTAIDGGAP